MSMLKFPNLCDQYRRISKVCLSEKEKKESHNQAVLTLRQSKLDCDPNNIGKHLEQLQDDIDH